MIFDFVNWVIEREEEYGEGTVTDTHRYRVVCVQYGMAWWFEIFRKPLAGGEWELVWMGEDVYL